MGKTKIALAVFFCLFIFGGTAASLFSPEREFSDRENRVLAQKPKLTKKKLLGGKYQRQYEKYMGDQFFWRDAWVFLASNIQAGLGKREINGVYIGKDGYLIEKEKTYDAEQAQDNIETLASFLNDAGEMFGSGHVRCLFVPSKVEALPNRLPPFLQAALAGRGSSAWEMLGDGGSSARETMAGRGSSREEAGLSAAVSECVKEKLDDKEQLVDLSGTMRDHCSEYIYYRTDHHWTTLGAFYAYQKWRESCGRDGADLSRYKRQVVFGDFYGTTYNRAGVFTEGDTVELFRHDGDDAVSVLMDGSEKYGSLYFPDAAVEGFNRYQIFLKKNVFEMEIKVEKQKTGNKNAQKNDADNKGAALVIKDSFANCFVPFLTDDFGKIVMVDYRYGKKAIGKIMDEHRDITDVIVLFNTEKFLGNTKLGKLADTRRNSGTMQEFNPEDFFS